jgi:hypothetical protein
MSNLVLSIEKLQEIENKFSQFNPNIATYIRWMLDPDETKRPTTAELLDKIDNDYPHLFKR